jgi:hypothetical protein
MSTSPGSTRVKARAERGHEPLSREARANTFFAHFFLRTNAYVRRTVR